MVKHYKSKTAGEMIVFTTDGIVKAIPFLKFYFLTIRQYEVICQ